MALPADYEERVYAGVLGKIIGVYLGRPLETVGDQEGGMGWTYDAITRSLGEVQYYCHEQLGEPLIVVDDDISGTFTFIRALEDYMAGKAVTEAQIGDTWLNYLIEGRTVLWWAGCGISTEHTAYLRLQQGIQAPQSGSADLNGRVMAEQIGGQIFVDGWAMVAPGDPILAADLARRAASVSHDGEAVYAAQMIAAMQSAAFVESRIDLLLDAGLSCIPKNCELRRVVTDLRDWHSSIPDWRDARILLESEYGYQKYAGSCPVIPNHAVILLGLLYGGNSFHRTLSIVNTCGWDTDCNSGNAGCLMGIRNGLQGIDEDGPEWRQPVADRLYVSTAEGGETVSDALRESQRIVRIGRSLAGEIPAPPKRGARFNFDLPGAVQGFERLDCAELQNVAEIKNVAGHSCCGERSLEISYVQLAEGHCARAATPTFIPTEIPTICEYYDLVACPTLYAGQMVQARVVADGANSSPVEVSLFAVAGQGEKQSEVRTDPIPLDPGGEHLFFWEVPDTGGYPIAQIGVDARSVKESSGRVYLDYLTWNGAPSTRLVPENPDGTLWARAWVDATDQPRRSWWPNVLRLVQNRGQGMLIQGTRDWDDYGFSARIRPLAPAVFGVAVRVRGLRRYYALVCCPDGTVRLVKRCDADEKVMGTRSNPAAGDETCKLGIEAAGPRIRAYINDSLVIDVVDQESPWTRGAVALLCKEGAIDASDVCVRPVLDT